MAEPNALGEPETTPPDTGQQNEPATEPNKKTTTRRKIQKIHLNREQGAAAGLLILTFELALCSILGSWRRVAAAHIALIAIILISFAIRAAVQRTKRQTSTGNTTRKLSDLLNPFRRTNTNTQPSGGRRNPFSGLFGGKGSPAGGAGSGRRNPFSGLFGGKGSPAGGGRKNPFSGLLGSRKNQTGESRKNPFSNLFGKRQGSPNGSSGRRNPFSGLFGGKGSPAGGAGSGRRNPFSGLFGGKDEKGKTEDQDKRAKDKGKSKDETKDKTKGKDETKDKDQAEDKTEDQAEDKTEDQAEDDQEETVNNDDGGVRVPADSGLHKWGRTLPQVEQEAARLKTRMKILETEINAFATDVSSLATIGETEQVNSTRTVVSQLQSIGAAVRKILASPASEMLAKIEGQASALWPTYSRDCAADEDRLQGARGTRRQERNADIGRAEADI